MRRAWLPGTYIALHIKCLALHAIMSLCYVVPACSVLEEEGSSGLDPLHAVGHAPRWHLQAGHQLVAVRAVVQGQGDALRKVVWGRGISGHPGNRARWDDAHREGISLVFQQS